MWITKTAVFSILQWNFTVTLHPTNKSISRSFHVTIMILSLGYGLDDEGFTVRLPAGAGSFLFNTASRTAPEPTQPPIQWAPGALFVGVKRPGREANHSPPFSAEVKECVEIYLHSPNTPSWRGAQKKAKGQLYCLLLPLLPACNSPICSTYQSLARGCVWLLLIYAISKSVARIFPSHLINNVNECLIVNKIKKL
jgi:hypothetical protein